MKRIITLLLIAVLLTACAGTGDAPSAPPSEEPSSSSQADSSAEDSLPDTSSGDAAEAALMKVIAENQNFLGGLTQEQKEEDYDYFWTVLNSSYPFLEYAGRMGLDAEELRATYRNHLETIDGDLDFMSLLYGVAGQFGYTGHLEFLASGQYYETYRDTYGEMAEQSPHFRYIHNVLTGSATDKTYSELRAVERKLEALTGSVSDNVKESYELFGAGADDGNVVTMFFDAESAAYVKIASFENSHIEADRETLLSFFREAASYDHMIIDLTGNGGGNDNYWIENIVAPNISAPLAAETRMLYAKNEFTQDYLETIDYVRDFSASIDTLPEATNFNSDDAGRMTHYTVSKTTVNPSGDTPWKGKIWVLTDAAVYSSAESFAMFCKNTGFATLVGFPTGGDGGGVDPMFFTLPNSGYAVRFSVFLTLNADGSGNEEFGTTPDIPCESGTSPLDVCLTQIREG